jgi:hypothetical protein
VAGDTTNEQEHDTAQPGSGSPKKKNVILAGAVVVVLIIAVIVAMGLMQSQAGKGTPQPSVVKSSIRPAPEVTVLQSQKVQNTPFQTRTRTIQQTPAPTTLPVDFVLQSGDAASCGLTCRQLDASITNTGDATAHNVCITVGLHNSRNEIISLNGEPSMNRCIGDISGGQKKTESITINADCGAFATKCIGETLTLQTQVTSQEKTVRFPDQVIAV